MDILHLTYFLEVARQKSFTKASQMLHVSQPSISKVIKTLENELGVTLLERSGREVELTDAGEAVFKRVQRVVIEFKNLASELSDVIDLKRGELTIGLPPMIGSRFFPKPIAQFRQTYPLIHLKLIEEGAKQIELAVQDGTLDLGVVALPSAREDFETFAFVNEPLRVVLYHDHPLARSASLSLAMLSNESFVLYREDFSLFDHILRQCQLNGFMPRIACQSSQWDFIGEMVGAKLGIALLPETICKELDPQRFVTIPMNDPIIPWHLAIIWKKDRYISFAAREWLRLTKNYFNEQRR
ncbi:MAG: transcriptional regulator, LysR family [Anaerosporomusa subterranea]|jgi:DNA-binding transcriptional LysR family regulator|nr:transcriptional regulator, LysR family [Anaerosporomusa subterranea]